MERTDLEQWRAKEVARLLALVETERRYYQEMVAMLPVALVVLSSTRNISYANRAFRQTFGLRSSDLRGRMIEQILPSDALVEKIRDVHMGGEGPVVIEHEGRAFQVSVMEMRNWDDEGEVETLLVLQEPGAAKGRGTTEAAAPNFTDIPAVLWEADAETLEIRKVRGDVETLLGFPANHWMRTPKFFEQRIAEEDRSAILELYRGESGDVSAEFRAVAASGKTVWVRETVRKSGGILTGVMTPIDRRKQLEDQLLRSGRTEALQGISSKLAHDLNNPLMIVTGYAEEMRDSLPENDPMRADADQILTATNRISAIAAQLLNFTRRHANPPTPVNITQTLVGMEEKMVRAAGEGCVLHLEGKYVWAMAEKAQLEEIVLTLISKDREDAAGRSNITIGCETDTISEYAPGLSLAPGTYTRLTIHDDGRGLDAAKSKSVFEGFIAKEEGIGTALARAYAIVREWGGDISFFSEPFRGSTFQIYLPHYDGTAEPILEPLQEAAPAEVPAAVPQPAPEPIRETILLVEDEAGIRALVRKILRRERYHVLEAGSAEEAATLASAHQGKIDLLVTDVMLPGASGRELAERVRELRPELCVLYISGYTDDDAVRTGAIPPGSRFLQKPFTLGALVGKVKESLAG
jgi:PAS domain S-box-containing protein